VIRRAAAALALAALAACGVKAPPRPPLRHAAAGAAGLAPEGATTTTPADAGPDSSADAPDPLTCPGCEPREETR
jgi:predicted small lipoprotein YifL